MAKRAKRTKTVDETSEIDCEEGNGLISEEVWTDIGGQVVKYNLAFINHYLCQVDNGRVLGYDNAHSVHERHWMGEVAVISFTTYKAVFRRFMREVAQFRK